MTKTYQHPETQEIRTPDPRNDVQIAALEKLGYVEITAEDIENDAGLAVVYQPVATAAPAVEAPALPHLAAPVAVGETREGAARKVAAARAVPRPEPREDAEPFDSSKR